MFSGGIEKQHQAVMNQVYNINIIYTNKLFYYIHLLPFSHFLELLVINHSLSDETFLFFGGWSFPMYWLFYNLHGCTLVHSWDG